MELQIRHIQDFLKKEIEACHESESTLFEYKLEALLDGGKVSPWHCQCKSICRVIFLIM